MIFFALASIVACVFAQSTATANYGPFILLHDAATGQLVCQGMLQNGQGLVDGQTLPKTQHFTMVTPGHCVTQAGQTNKYYDLVIKVLTTDATFKPTRISHTGSSGGRLIGFNMSEQYVQVHPDFHKHYIPSDVSTWNVDLALIRITKSVDVSLLQAFFAAAPLEAVRYPLVGSTDASGLSVIGFDPARLSVDPRSTPRVATSYSSCDGRTVKWPQYTGTSVARPGSGSAVLVNGDLYGVYLGHGPCRRSQPKSDCHRALRTETVTTRVVTKRAAVDDALTCDLAEPTHVPTVDADQWVSNEASVTFIVLFVLLALAQLVAGIKWVLARRNLNRDVAIH